MINLKAYLVDRIRFTQTFDPQAPSQESATEEQRKQRLFAHWCLNHNVAPIDAAVLIALGDKAGRLQIKANNDGPVPFEENNRKANEAMEKFEEFAKSLGFETEWNGYYPGLLKDDQTIWLPF